MKKFIAIIICTFILISVFAVSAFAMEIKPYVRVINFSNTDKSYPIGDSVENATRFFEYYEVNPHNTIARFVFPFIEDAYPDYFSEIRSSPTNYNIIAFVSEYPFFNLSLIKDNSVTDIAIIYEDGLYKVINYVGSDILTIDGSNYFINDLLNTLNTVSSDSSQVAWATYFVDDLAEGHYIQFPRTNEERIAPSVFNSILPALGAFVGGIGSAFATGFTSVFMTNGSINALGIFILVLVGVSLGYGVVRWITGLFRKESN